MIDVTVPPTLIHSNILITCSQSMLSLKFGAPITRSYKNFGLKSRKSLQITFKPLFLNSFLHCELSSMQSSSIFKLNLKIPSANNPTPAEGSKTF